MKKYLLSLLLSFTLSMPATASAQESTELKSGQNEQEKSQQEINELKDSPIFYTFFEENEEPTTWEALKELFGINTLIKFLSPHPHGTIATVNDDVITLNELQFYADLEKSSQSDDSEVSLEGVMEDYSTYLLELIQQKLIKQEVKNLSLSVDYSTITRIQQGIEKRYTESLESGLLASEVHQKAWAEQIKSNLEREALQRYFLSSLKVDYEEIIKFHIENEGLFNIPEQYIFTLVYSENESALRKALNKKVNNPELAGEYKVSIQQATLDINSIPEAWKREVVKLKPNQFSKLKKIENSYFYIMLNEKAPAQTASQTEAFLEIERILLDAKLRNAYETWLEKAVLSAEIFIAPEFSAQSRINLGTINTLEVSEITETTETTETINTQTDSQ